MSGLEQAVCDLLGRRSLSEDRLRALQAMQGDLEPDREQGGGSRPAHLQALYRTAMAAVLVFAVLAPILAWLSFSVSPDRDLPELIADEVAVNHLKLKPMEVRGDEIANIRDYFTELDFLPVRTSLPAIQDFALLGGRYCSVQGVTAAQLRLRPAAGAPLQTLYQAPYGPQRFGPLPNLDEGERPLILDARGLRVRLWVEKGILFALTGE